MDFNITGEEEALVLRIQERLAAGDNPTENSLAEELGDDARARLQSLADKGWVSLIQPPEGGPTLVSGLSPMAHTALSDRRNA
ncbi:hypothetical protein ABZW18_16645 [Streptomyces sp. NPDC004647]|uniref:hypothetical protein n=1 Tax=Streptomyces sp. NPDC004647 TaxID=3154671 RepID=UPI0033B324D7